MRRGTSGIIRIDRQLLGTTAAEYQAPEPHRPWLSERRPASHYLRNDSQMSRAEVVPARSAGLSASFPPTRTLKISLLTSGIQFMDSGKQCHC